MQFAVTATSKNDIESKLHFLENEIIKLEKDWKEQEGLHFPHRKCLNYIRRNAFIERRTDYGKRIRLLLFLNSIYFCHVNAKTIQ